MEKKITIQKKKTSLYTLLEVLVKILIVMIVIVLALIAVQKLNLSNTFDFSNSKSKDVERIPSELKWFDDFKGIENIPDKDTEKDGSSGGSKNFLQYEGSK